MKRVGLAIVLAFVLWTVMFSPWTAPHLNFWAAMTISAAVLMTMVPIMCVYPFLQKHFTKGIMIGAVKT